MSLLPLACLLTVTNRMEGREYLKPVTYHLKDLRSRYLITFGTTR